MISKWIWRGTLLTLFHTAWGGHHPLFTLNVSNINWDGVRWLKTFWQLSFKPSWCTDKVYFMIYYWNILKIWILKHLVQNFWVFWAIFMNWWLWGKHSWLWIGSAGFKSRRDLTFFRPFQTNKKVVLTLWLMIILLYFQYGIYHYYSSSKIGKIWI